MKKSILNIGKALNKAEQKQITGGKLIIIVISHTDCEEGDGQTLAECQVTCGIQGECVPCGSSQYRCDYSNTD